MGFHPRFSPLPRLAALTLSGCSIEYRTFFQSFFFSETAFWDSFSIIHPETRNFGRDQGMRKILPQAYR
jgi:hypothetical protein